jgi:hypothetical protein
MSCICMSRTMNQTYSLTYTNKNLYWYIGEKASEDQRSRTTKKVSAYLDNIQTSTN